MTTRASQAIREAIPDEELSTEGIARRLGMSTRSFRRALRQAGTSYKSLLNYVRAELAQQYISEQPESSGTELADRLGYKNVPAFYRAFQRWTGMTLGAYRERGR